jgi:enhancing lycopene biosynthesis protein 2
MLRWAHNGGSKKMTKRVGVILAGCGWLDGAEVHEAVCTLLSLDQRGAEVIMMAPDVDQMHVVDHLGGDPSGDRRNVLVESARIARGEVVDIRQVQVADLDALVLPGGFGAAKNLCSFAVDGPKMTINADVERLVRGMHAAQKPQGFICIAPAIGAAVLGPDHGVELTIGNDTDTAAAITSMGARHIETVPGQIHIDLPNKVVSTPAYMLGPSIAQVYAGIDALVETVIELTT